MPDEKSGLVFLPNKTEDGVLIEEPGLTVLKILDPIVIKGIYSITCKVNNGEDEEVSSEIEMVESDPPCGESSKNLYLSSLINTEEDFDKSFVHKLSLEILTNGYTVLAA